MNISIYVRREIAEKMAKIAKKTHRSRNSIVAEALDEWLDKHCKPHWPKHFFDFEPLDDNVRFDEFRKGLSEISEDPLA